MSLTIRQLATGLQAYLTTQLHGIVKDVDLAKPNTLPTRCPSVLIYILPQPSSVVLGGGESAWNDVQIKIAACCMNHHSATDSIIDAIELCERVQQSIMSGFMAYAATIGTPAGLNIAPDAKTPIMFDDFYTDIAVAVLSMTANCAPTYP